jgi:hypothetical protein
MISKILWKSLLVAPTVLGVSLVAAVAIAAPSQLETGTETSESAQFLQSEDLTVESTPIFLEEFAPSAALVEIAQVPANEVPSTSTDATLDQLLQYSNEGMGSSNSQVTSITQLSDVRPTDWAFQALQSLVERYGCVAGYPDGTFRGNQAMTRYEAAALVNACLDRISELLDLSDLVTQDDLAAIQRLQEEFAAELATLRGRIDGLEARVSELEANQFSTTTKLRGEVIFMVSGVLEEDDRFDDQIFFGHRTRLNFDTSFTGQDRLRTRLQARNIPTFQTDQIGFAAGGGSNTFSIDDLIYTFPVGDAVNVLIGANGVSPQDLVPSTISPLDSSGRGSISDFGLPRQYAQGSAGNGAGGSLTFELGESFALTGGYIGSEPAGSSGSIGEGTGFFNGDYNALGQLTFLSDALDAAVTFMHSYDASGFDLGVYDVGAPSVANTFGGQFNFKIDDFQIGGGLAYTFVRRIGTPSDFEAWSYQGTLAINDLGGAGNQLGILAGVLPYSAELTGTDLGEARVDDTAFLAEAYYRFRVNNNISLTPSLIFIHDAFNNSDIDDAFIGTLRTTFTF